jgi:hypothetical protein
MLLLQEKTLFRGETLEVELHDDLRYRLVCGGVVYENNYRTTKGKKLPYQFRSVEQLRYDFEKDIAQNS